MRRELKISRTQVHDLEASINIMKKQNTGSYIQPEPDKSEITSVEAEKLIDLQKQEMRRLRAQIVDLEAKLQERPPSGSRLPPLSQVTI